jgi:hypothetical protein
VAGRRSRASKRGEAAFYPFHQTLNSIYLSCTAFLMFNVKLSKLSEGDTL